MFPFAGWMQGEIGPRRIAFRKAVAIGAAAPTIYAIGSILIPSLTKAGYPPERAAAIVAAASGMGMLIPGNVVVGMFFGGLIEAFWRRTNAKQADAVIIPLASGLIAGEAIMAVIIPIVRLITGNL